MPSKKEIQEFKKKEKESRCWAASGVFVPGGLLLGIGLGFVYNNVAAGTLIGLGTGFILMGLVRLFCK